MANSAKATTKTTSRQKTTNVPVAHGVGRRKSSVARAWMTRGNGKLVVNGKDYAAYFDTDVTRLSAFSPFLVCEQLSNYDVAVNVQGGGMTGQADATKLAIARAVIKHYEDLKPQLRAAGLVTVDSRLKERKKYGQKAARRRFQFVKR